MANPFPARFDSNCQSCGEKLFEGDNTFAVNGQFICTICAEAGDYVCDCGNFKKEGFKKCYTCHMEETNPDPPTDYESPPF